MLTETQAAYLAGILDGEGCLLIRKSTSSNYNVYESAVQVGTSTPVLLDWIESLIPGGRRTIGNGVGNREPQHLWVLGTKESLRWLLPQVIPYLVIKKLHGQLLLKYCEVFAEQIPGVKLTEDEVSLKNAYCTMFDALNSRGIGSLDKKAQVLSLFASGEIALPGVKRMAGAG